MTAAVLDPFIKLGNDVDAIFRAHGVTDGFGVGDFVVTDNLVTDIGRRDARISDAIVESTWPRIRQGTVVHYTRRARAQSIIDTRCLRLYELFKRVSQHEMRDFFDHHGFRGYLETVDGKPGYHDLMKKMFYASFTSAGLLDREERYMWGEFAPSLGDVRLTFEVEAESYDLRKIKYVSARGEGISLIRQLQERTRELDNREFLFRGVSRVAAFYLRGDYEEEQEVRLLHARYDPSQSDIHLDGEHWYVKLPLDGAFHMGFRLVPRLVETRAGVDRELTEMFLAM